MDMEKNMPLKECLKSYFPRLAVASISSLLVQMPLSVYAENLSGPEFSNPAELAVVSKDWATKKIQYDKKAQDADLVIALGQQTHPMFKDLVKEYAKNNNLKIHVTPGTCGITAGKLLRKKVDLGALCCPPGKTDRLPGLKFHSLGISPIALIVHPDNPIKNVTSKQARQIFQGHISHWNELSKNNMNTGKQLIQPVGRLHCKIRPGHWRGLLKNEDLFSSNLTEVGVIADMISKIGRNSRSIGYEVPLMVSYHKAKGDVRMIKIDGHSPSDTKHVLSGKYPLYRTYHLTTWENDRKATRHAHKLIAYLRENVEKNYSEYGFIPPSKLKKAGWKFKENELIGEPK